MKILCNSPCMHDFWIEVGQIPQSTCMHNIILLLYYIIGMQAKYYAFIIRFLYFFAYKSSVCLFPNALISDFLYFFAQELSVFLFPNAEDVKESYVLQSLLDSMHASSSRVWYVSTSSVGHCPGMQSTVTQLSQKTKKRNGDTGINCMHICFIISYF